MARTQVGIRELKSDLSRWVSRVRSGDEVVVTDRGTPVARLMPVSGREPLRELIAAGLVEPARRHGKRLRPSRLSLRGKGQSLADYVSRQRR